MKLFAFFVPGTVGDAVALVNELSCVYEFHSMYETKKTRVVNPFVPTTATEITGHRVFVKVTDGRAKWLQHQLTVRELSE